MSANDSPAVFSDEQLKTTKEKWVAERYEMRPDEIEALLNRLDAAEALIKRSALWHDGECEILNGVSRYEEECDCGSYAASRKWMKTRGKDQ